VIQASFVAAEKPAKRSRCATGTVQQAIAGWPGWRLACPVNGTDHIYERPLPTVAQQGGTDIPPRCCFAVRLGRLTCTQLIGRHFARLVIAPHLVVDFLPVVQTAHTGALDGRNMDEDVSAAVIRLDKTETLCRSSLDQALVLRFARFWLSRERRWHRWSFAHTKSTKCWRLNSHFPSAIRYLRIVLNVSVQPGDWCLKGIQGKSSFAIAKMNQSAKKCP
jgi:hypothetical protein